jgi:DNA-binding transcriptional regulator LsrR (DeoR family)
MREIAGEARRGVAGKDSVLIATRDEHGRRTETICAVLEGRYLSTLITDTATAVEVLSSARSAREGADE